MSSHIRIYSNPFSCALTHVTADSYDITELVIICEGAKSCDSLVIDIDDIDRVNIHCIGEKACADMQASFDGISSQNNTNTFISCYTENACTDLHILSYPECEFV